MPSLHHMISAIILITIVIGLLPGGNITAQTTGNEYCPVTMSEKADPNIFIDYEGQRIHFCCQSCKRDFLADPDKYLGNLNSDTAESDPSQLTDYEPEGDSTAAKSNQSSHGRDNERESEEAGHNHATDHGSETNLISFLGKFHPVVIHFPIALVIMALIFVGCRVVMGIEIFDQMAAMTMYWAAIFAVIAALLGLARGAGADFPSLLEEYFRWHRLFGLAGAGLTVGTAVTGYFWRRSGSRKMKILFRGLLFLNVIVIGITGHLGATLVYGPDYYG